jgi:ribose/xylose/arabinose/galactoside ABC-type transport system permease subunit
MDKKQSGGILLFIVDNLIWVLVLISLAVFSIIAPSFFTPYNLLNLLVREAPLGLLVVGQAFTLITGNFDLSSESTMGFTAMAAALLLASKDNGGLGIDMNPFLSILVMLAIGAAIGALNGFFITKLKMNNFIMTLAMMMILRGATYAISPGNSVSFLPDFFTWLGGAALFKIPLEGTRRIAVPVAMFFVILSFLVAYVITRYRRFGRNMYAVGSSQQAARAAGVDIDKVILGVYIVSGVCAALAGLLDAGRMNSATPRTGQGLIFPVQAAAVIGGISLFGGRGNMIGAFGGVLLWGILDTGLNIAKVSPFWIEVSRGGVLLFAMFIDAVKVSYLHRMSIRKVLAKSLIGMSDPGWQAE